MAIPDFQTLMLPALRRIGSNPIRTAELIAQLSDEMNLTEEERSQLLPSGRQPVINNRVHWAIAYLNKAGLVTRIRRGEYAISPAGETLLAAKPERISLPFLLQKFPSIRAFRGEEAATTDLVALSPTSLTPLGPTATPEEVLLGAAEEVRTSLVAELLDRVRCLQPIKFEALMVNLLLSLGFGGGPEARRGERLGMSGDGGVDGVMREDALGLDVVYIQAKRYAVGNAVGPEAIQAFAGSLLERGATKGVFATTSRFTDGARRAAERLSTQRRIVLIDGEELARLMMDRGVGLRTLQTIQIQRVDLSDYEDED